MPILLNRYLHRGCLILYTGFGEGVAARIMRRIFCLTAFIISLFAGFLLLAKPSSAADAQLEIRNIRLGFHIDKTRIVIDLDRETDFRAFVLGDPYRVVIDMPKADWRISRSAHQNTALIKRYRSGELAEGLTRIVFDMEKPALISEAYILPRTDTASPRLVVDVAPASLNLFEARKTDVIGKRDLTSLSQTVQNLSHNTPAAASSYRAHQNANVATSVPASGRPLAPLPTRKPARKFYTIVIDAGHGGKDPGAVAPGKVYEKHITLALAKELKRQLEETGRYRAVLTRDRDIFIPLRGRVDIARRADADMFISLHADKIGRTNVRGASIYTLSEVASDKETARLAHDENFSGMVAGVDISDEGEDVANILLDLAMREKMNESNMLAQKLESSFRQKGVRLLGNPHRSAGFAVLKAPDVPSVLIEAGFLSNAAEAKLLRTSAFQRKLSTSIVQGIDAYFRKIEALNKS